MTYQTDCTLPEKLLEQIAQQGLDVLPDIIRTVINTAMQVVRQNHFHLAKYLPINSHADSLDWSPDGKRFAVSHNDRGPWVIALMKADGSELREINKSYASFADFDQPDWSPDGEQLAFSPILKTIWSIISGTK